MNWGSGFSKETIQIYKAPTMSAGKTLIGTINAHRQEHFIDPMESGAGIISMDLVVFFIYGTTELDIQAGDIIETTDNKRLIVKDIIRHETARRKYIQIITGGEE